jgi:hypothetical protein
MMQLRVPHPLDAAGMRCQTQGRDLTSLKQPLFSTTYPLNCSVSAHIFKKCGSIYENKLWVFN